MYSPFLMATRERWPAHQRAGARPDGGRGDLPHRPGGHARGREVLQRDGAEGGLLPAGADPGAAAARAGAAQRLSAERLEAVLQAAISLRSTGSASPPIRAAIDAERKLLEKALTEQARDALARVTQEYVQVATPERSAQLPRGGRAVGHPRGRASSAGEIEPVKKMVMAESGGAFRVQPRSKIRDLMVFALGEDLHALRNAIGTSVEVQTRK